MIVSVHSNRAILLHRFCKAVAARNVGLHKASITEVLLYLYCSASSSKVPALRSAKWPSHGDSESSLSRYIAAVSRLKRRFCSSVSLVASARDRRISRAGCGTASSLSNTCCRGTLSIRLRASRNTVTQLRIFLWNCYKQVGYKIVN